MIIREIRGQNLFSDALYLVRRRIRTRNEEIRVKWGQSDRIHNSDGLPAFMAEGLSLGHARPVAHAAG